MTLPYSARDSNLVPEQVSFNEALRIISELYGYQRKYPWEPRQLLELMAHSPTGTGNVYFDGESIWVWEKFMYARKYSPKRRLQIIWMSPMK